MMRELKANSAALLSRQQRQVPCVLNLPSDFGGGKNPKNLSRCAVNSVSRTEFRAG
jgi:hypothetical protein